MNSNATRLSRLEKLEQAAAPPPEPFTNWELICALLTDVSRRLMQWSDLRDHYKQDHSFTRENVQYLSLRPVEVSNLGLILGHESPLPEGDQRARELCKRALEELPRQDTDGEQAPTWAIWQEGAIRGSHLLEWLWGALTVKDDESENNL